MQNYIESYEECMNSLKKGMQDYPWGDSNAYGDWLAQTYYFASVTTRLLTLASSVTPMANEALHRRFIDHAIEERGHEVMLINDLRAIDKKLSDYPELYPSAGLYQSQYYWIAHHNPDAFFGYIVMLEGLGALHCHNAYEKVKAFHGAKAGVFLKVHSEEDQDHVKKALAHVETFSIETKSLVQKNMEHSTHFYVTMLEEAKKRSYRLGSTNTLAA